MKVKHGALVSLLKELDFAAADGWALPRLEKKLETLPATVKAEELEPKTADGKALLKKLLAALKAGEKIEITDVPSEKGGKKDKPAKEEKAGKKEKPVKDEDDSDEDDEDEDSEDSDEEEDASDDDDEDEDSEESDEDGDEEASDDEDEDEDEEEAPPKKGKKKPTKEEDDEDEDESDDEDEDEEEEKPAKKKKKGNFPKSAGGDGKPGVIASIQEFLTNASKDKPISKKKILEKLTTRFPDRAAESMERTINVQVPNRMAKDKGVVIKKNDKGYWISGKAKAAEAETKASKETDDEDDED